MQSTKATHLLIVRLPKPPFILALTLVFALLLEFGHDYACIAYGINATNIDVYDPMPGRNNFNVTRNAFRYMIGVVSRVLTEYCLIQW